MGSVDDSTVALWSDSIRKKGFFWVSDKAVGERVDKIIETGYPFDQKDGLIFCRLSTVGDEVSEETCKELNDQLTLPACAQGCKLGHWTT